MWMWIVFINTNINCFIYAHHIRTIHQAVDKPGVPAVDMANGKRGVLESDYN